MGFIDCASFASIWRGYEYYKEGMVLTFEEQADGNVQGLVKGSEGNIYSTVIDPYHPRKSSCDCPHAEGKRKVCKHKIALYFNFCNSNFWKTNYFFLELHLSFVGF